MRVQETKPLELHICAAMARKKHRKKKESGFASDTSDENDASQGRNVFANDLIRSGN